MLRSRLRIMIFCSRSYMWPEAMVKMWMVSGSSSGLSSVPGCLPPSLEPPNQEETLCRRPPASII